VLQTMVTVIVECDGIQRVQFCLQACMIKPRGANTVASARWSRAKGFAREGRKVRSRESEVACGTPQCTYIYETASTKNHLCYFSSPDNLTNMAANAVIQLPDIRSWLTLGTQMAERRMARSSQNMSCICLSLWACECHDPTFLSRALACSRSSDPHVTCARRL